MCYVTCLDADRNSVQEALFWSPYLTWGSRIREANVLRVTHSKLTLSAAWVLRSFWQNALSVLPVVECSTNYITAKTKCEHKWKLHVYSTLFFKKIKISIFGIQRWKLASSATVTLGKQLLLSWLIISGRRAMEMFVPQSEANQGRYVPQAQSSFCSWAVQSTKPLLSQVLRKSLSIDFSWVSVSPREPHSALGSSAESV